MTRGRKPSYLGNALQLRLALAPSSSAPSAQPRRGGAKGGGSARWRHIWLTAHRERAAFLVFTPGEWRHSSAMTKCLLAVRGTWFPLFYRISSGVSAAGATTLICA
jgi:hypothetical protein